MSQNAKGVVFFDGDCSLCNSSIRSLIKMDPDKLLLYAPLQGETAEAVIDRHDELGHDLDTMVYVRAWDTEQEVVFTRSSAILEILRDLGGWRKIAIVFKLVPEPIRDAVYNWVARHRHKWQSAPDACELREQKQNQDRLLP